MIPKIIHYCWFGGKPLPKSAKKCIESWKKFLPDYEIKEWNESNFNINIIPYTSEAYRVAKYAFVSDYARFWILYKYGGIYFDTDVEVLRNMNDIIIRGPFMAREDRGEKYPEVATGLVVACEPRDKVILEIIKRYNLSKFVNDKNDRNIVNVVEIVSSLFINKGLTKNNKVQKISNFFIYPREYFCPMDSRTGIVKMTKNTYAIHWYAGSWLNKGHKLNKKIKKIIGPRFTNFVIRIKARILNMNSSN